MMPTTFQRESLVPIWMELAPLMAAHWMELNPADDLPFCPDVRTYEDCEAAGIFRLFTARREGGLIGYNAFFVRSGLHCKDVLQATHDALWVHPAFRHFTSGKFMIWCDQQLAEEGVSTVSQNSRLDHPIDSTLKKLGYEPTETVWVRRFSDLSRAKRSVA